MKQLTKRITVLLVAAVCVSMIMPSLVFAGEVATDLFGWEPYGPGRYTENLTLLGNGNTNKIVFKVENGEAGKKMVSSVKVDLLNEKGEVDRVLISPDKFGQNKVGSVVVTLDDVDDLEELYLSIRVGGPQNSTMKFKVTEYYEKNCWPPWTCGSSSWMNLW